MGKICFLLSVSLLLLASESVSGSTWYVDGSVSASGDGTSWATAFKKIQEGINTARHGDTVIVAEGTYIERIYFKGKNIVLRSTDPLDPDVVQGTIIDGDQLKSVVWFSGTESETCVLSGFTIRNGRTDQGGGIRGLGPERATRARIENNVIIGNSAQTGAGIANCDGTVQGNIIRDNSADQGGGGLYGCHGAVQNNLIVDNSAYYGGGLDFCSGTIQNNTILNNFARNDEGGGGLYNCKGTIRNCIIWGNRAAQLVESNAPSYSCVQGWTSGGTGNTNLAPAFVDSAGGDYRLQAPSPCIEAGIEYYWFAWPQRDLDGNCRLAGEKTDMGCYEYGSPSDSDGDLLSDEEESVHGTDANRDDTDGDGLRDGLEILRGTDPVAPSLPGILHVPSEIPRVQQALCLALSGEEIVVGPGTYRENIRFCDVPVRLRSSDPANRDTVLATILDGGGEGPVVSFAGNERENYILSGFSVRNGKATGGGGIRGGNWEDHTLATISNNRISSNSASWGGGLYACDGAIRENEIVGNRGSTGGGLYDCNATIQSNLVSGNWADDGGGGLYWCRGTIQNNTIKGNSAGARGGGGLSYCGGTIQNNTITGNSAAPGYGGDGGGLYECYGTIENNLVSGNSAYDGGGGLSSCGGTIQSNLISGNSATSGGGLYDCGGTIQNNTIAANRATDTGGGLRYCDGMIENSIVWGNTAPTGPQLFDSSLPRYSCIQDWTEGGEGNIAEDPQFVDADGPDDKPETYEDNDFRLQAASPCIDAGKNENWTWGTLDLLGNVRIFNGGKSPTVDMGAYEYGSWPFKIVGFLQGGTGEGRITWNSRPGDAYTVWSCVALPTGVWAEEASVASQGESTSWTDAAAVGQQKFYRIELK